MDARSLGDSIASQMIDPADLRQTTHRHDRVG
jgi:hypothetical protein